MNNTTSPIQLLIVEDDEDDFFLLESTLRQTSFESQITWTNSFEKSKHALQTSSFDLVLIDYRLGVHTGIEVISFINDNFPYTPTILLTGLKEIAIDQEALKSGVYDYLAKDQYTAESLDRSIRYAIQKSRVLKSLKESENKFKNLFENAVEYVFLLDSNHTVIGANKAALKLFGCERENRLIGVNISSYIVPDIFKINLPISSSIEIELTIPELNKKCFCILNLSVVDAEKNISQLVLHDITERILNEEKEKMLEKQALTGKVARIIAHEIKNPLTNIQLSVLELRSMFPEQVSVKYNAQSGNDEPSPNEFLNIIESNSKRINTLIEDLLHATRFDTIRPTKFYIHELIADALTHIQDRMRLKGISMEKNVQENILVNGDKEKLVIALVNILVNAVEAVAEKAGKLIITTNASDSEVNISIEDNGKGIPQQDMNKLFEPFFTSKKGGTGLGLTATYNIVVKHDGGIKVNSKEGEGTVFIITLPKM